jgi:hypothetical protein
MKVLWGVLVFLVTAVLAGVRIYLWVIFNINCGGHMVLAGNANNVDLARQEMELVVKYAKDHDMTSGYTSVLYNAPDEDMGFWFKNMSASLDELRRVKPETTELEKSNLLIKLKETLVNHDGKVNIPAGVSVFPNNTFFAVVEGITFGPVVLCFIIFWKKIDEGRKRFEEEEKRYNTP